jgi:hypothetical protein
VVFGAGSKEVRDGVGFGLFFVCVWSVLGDMVWWLFRCWLGGRAVWLTGLVLHGLTRLWLPGIDTCFLGDFVFFFFFFFTAARKLPWKS